MIKPCSPLHPVNVGLLLLGAVALGVAARGGARGSRAEETNLLSGQQRRQQGQIQRTRAAQQARARQGVPAQQRPKAPTVDTMISKLGISPQQAEQIREKMKSGRIIPALEAARVAMGGYDVRVLRGKEDQPMRFTGLEFVDTADAWRDTLLYDYGRNRFFIAPWGDTVDANQERF